MKNLRKILAVLLTVCMLVGMISLTASAVSIWDHGETYSESNGDGFTAYDLEWDISDGKAIAKFKGQFIVDFSDLKYSYSVVVRNTTSGEDEVVLNVSPQKSDADESTLQYSVDVSSAFTEEGTYVFTIAAGEHDATGMGIGTVGQISRSAEYTYGGATNSEIIEAPSNLRFEKDGDTLWCVWDTPEGWVEGRDSFNVGLFHINNEPDWRFAVGSPNNKSSETRYEMRTSENHPIGEDVFYTFSVQSVSGDVGMQASSTNVYSSVKYNSITGEITPWVYTPTDENSIMDGASVTTTEPTETPTPSATVSALSTPSKVLVDGTDTAFDAYNIDGNNYFKLRDLANVVSGTEKQFEVTWDEEMNAINLISGNPYTTVGGEMSPASGVTKEGTLSTSAVYVDGKETEFTAYNIDGNNYFKLRDVAKVFDIGITWDGETSTIGIDTSISYVE